MLVTTLAGSWLVALALLLWCGWGLAYVLTPPALVGVRPLLMPFFGYTLLTICAYYGLWLGLPLDTSRWLIVGLAALINLLALRRRSHASIDWADVGVALSLALIGAIVAVLPLLFHGLLAPIGDSWDVEFYLPLATYLRKFPYAQLSAAPANPLVTAIQVDPTYARAIGFAYFQGIVDSFGGWDALRTFAPLLGFMRGLAAIAVWLFARYGLRLSRWSAALAALLVALNELLLWVQYAGFAMHASSMPLVPIALLLTIIALRELRWRSTAAATLLLACLATNYHPALLGYGALALGAGLWYLWRSEQRTAVVGHGVALLAGAAAITWLVQVRAQRAFFTVYEQGAAPLGSADFISLRTLLGLTPLATDQVPAPPPWGAGVASIWPSVVWVTFGLALALAGLWLLRGRGARGLALAMIVTSVIYAFGLREAAGYAYGYMKGLSFISFVPLAVVAGGVGTLLGMPRPRWLTTTVAGLASALLLLVVGSTAWSSFSLVRSSPGLYGRERLQLLDIAADVPADATVWLSGAEELRGPTLGIIAYALREHPLVGRTATGFQVFDALPPGVIAPYGVFGPNDDPTAWGFDPQALWRNDLASLHAAAPQRLAHLHGQPAVYTEPYPTALHRNTALELALLGNERYLTLNQPLDLAVGTSSLTIGDSVPDQPTVQRHLALAVATLDAATVQIAGGGIDQTIALTPGVTLISTESIAAPAVVRLSSDAPVVLRWAELYPADAAPTLDLSDTLMITATTTPISNGARLALRVTPTNQRLRVALEIYEDSSEPRHYGQALLPLGDAQLVLDLAAGTLHVNGNAAPVTWFERTAGRYFAALWVYQGDTLIGRVPLWTFSDDSSGQFVVTPLDSNALFISPPAPDRHHNVRFGASTTLLGTTYTPARAGKTAHLSLWWHAAGPTPPLLVTAQVLGTEDRKWAQWDGALGGDAAPSPAWRAGEIVRQDVPLPIDAVAPAGPARLLIGIYNPADGLRVPLSNADDTPADDSFIQSVEILP